MRIKQNALVFIYILFLFMILRTQNKNLFLLMGLFGQILLINLSVNIYKSKHVWTSLNMYALMYVLFVLSFSCLDVYFYLSDPLHFTGTIHDENSGTLLIDFINVNMSVISTMGLNNILPSSTMTRAYFSYKIMIAIFMIVFVVSDITIEKKNNFKK